MAQLISAAWPYVVACGAILAALRSMFRNRKEIADSWFWVKRNVLLRNEHHRLETLEEEDQSERIV